MIKELNIFIKSLLNYVLWYELAQSRIRARFNRTVLGPLGKYLVHFSYYYLLFMV